MSERERWIVYPLLFFALGAALRDKILRQVDAKEIRCESLEIVDPHSNEGRPVAFLKSLHDPDPKHDGRIAILSVNQLYIAEKDNPTKVLAELGTRYNPDPKKGEEFTFLKVDRFLCEGVYIADEQDPMNVLVEVSTAQAPALQSGETPKRVGVLSLRDNQNSQVTEVRADQLLARRIACDQLHVIDPNKRSRIIALTQAIPGPRDEQGEATIDYEGMIILNNVPITARPQQAPRPATDTND
jgi:hypothetical protein